MLYLLELRREMDVRLPPIADATAAQLERVLLLNATERPQHDLCRVIARDPFLAAWIDHQCQQTDRAHISTVTGAATWLNRGLAEKLTSTLTSRCPPGNGVERVRTSDLRKFAKLGAEIVDGATELVGPGDVHSAPVFWTSLIKQTHRLIDCCPEGIPQDRCHLPVFPPVPPPDREHRESAPTATQEAAIAPAQAAHVDYLCVEIPGVEWRLPALISRMAELSVERRTFVQRLEQEKLASLKELAYGASHEINNPLANIAARAQTLLKDEAAPDRRRKLKAIFEQAMRAHEMIADLMLFAHPPALIRCDCNLAELVRIVVAELKEEAANREIDLGGRIESDSQLVSADKTQMLVALRALVVNALEAVAHGGRVEIAVPVVSATGNLAQIIVRDDGPGVNDNLRNHIFDPFFSGREAGRGLGFGLSKCWRIVSEHGGRVEVRPATWGGAEFVVFLPFAGAQSIAA